MSASGLAGLPLGARVLLYLHLGFALSGPAFAFLSAYFYSTPDANIGYGLGLLWAAVWGLPWSIWPLMTDSASIPVQIAVFTACALLNVVLHAGVWAWLLRRRRARQQREATAGGSL